MTSRMEMMLSMACRREGVSAVELVDAYYRVSLQPMKKTMGVFQQMRRMERRGWLTSRGPRVQHAATTRFYVTPAGRAAGRESVATTYCRPQPFMRLVKD